MRFVLTPKVAASDTVSRGTLLILTQVYVPDPAAVGQQLADVGKEMARQGWRVVVYASDRGYDDPTARYPRRETRDGVEIRRLPFSSFGKGSIALRLVAQSCLLFQAVLRGLFTRDLRLVLVTTAPPFAGFAGVIVSWIRRARLVWWVMDLNPDQMIAAGKLRPGSWIARACDAINRLTLRRSDAVVILDRFMTDRVLAKLDVRDKVHVMPPWPHDDVLQRRPARPNRFRSEQRFGDAFVVMYSGNHAIQHSLETLLDAAAKLEQEPDWLFAFVGGGAGKASVERRIADGATNVVSLPFQPLEAIGESLSAADVQVVSMGNDMVGIVHPCKIYGALTVGRPILFFGPERSHIGDLLKEHVIGHVVSHGDVGSAVAALRELRAMSEHDRARLGDRAAQVGGKEFSRAQLLLRFCDILARDAV